MQAGDGAPFYHPGSRALQDRFDSRRIADRIEQVTLHDVITPDDAALLTRVPMFFLATVEPTGQPDVSFKGGPPGFLRVLDERTLAFPHYDGNGMFRSLGNITAHPEVALLFVDFEHPFRIRVHGTASVSADDPLLPTWERAQLVVRVAVTRVFPNCPRYIPTMHVEQYSPYLPEPGREPPVPDWKLSPAFRDALPGSS